MAEQKEQKEQNQKPCPPRLQGSKAPRLPGSQANRVGPAAVRSRCAPAGDLCGLDEWTEVPYCSKSRCTRPPIGQGQAPLRNDRIMKPRDLGTKGARRARRARRRTTQRDATRRSATRRVDESTPTTERNSCDLLNLLKRGPGRSRSVGLSPARPF
jgi:hypothetical protein